MRDGASSAEIVLHLFDRMSALHQADLFRLRLPSGGTLRPVHATMLWYLDRCNRPSATPSGLAHYLQLTRGTVSVSVRHLEELGLLARTPDTADRRRVRLELTAAGRRLARRWQADRLVGLAAAGLPPGHRRQLIRELEVLAATMVQRGGGRTFGVCRSCAHFRPAGPARRAGGAHCALLDIPLVADETERICVEHAPAA